MGAMDNRKLIYILAGLLLVIAAAFGFSLTRGAGEKKDDQEVGNQTSAKADEAGSDACASNATYARLKEVAFEEAMKQRTGGASANLDTLAERSVVRMEDPVVQSRDEDLNVTVCSGRFIVELPPGSEAAFGGQRRLSADIEYSAQAAADGSGLVYQLRGAEPIIAKLAAFDLGNRQLQMPQTPQAPVEYAEAAPATSSTLPAPRQVSSEAPAPPPAPRPAPAPRPREVPPEVSRPPAPAPRREVPAPPRPTRPPVTAEAPSIRRGAFSNPSFNCRSARTSGERAVCSSQSLAAKDRAMSSMFFSALASADAPRRAELRRTRDKFLRYRDRCGSDACIAEAYDGRIQEIRDIMEAE